MVMWFPRIPKIGEWEFWIEKNVLEKAAYWNCYDLPKQHEEQLTLGHSTVEKMRKALTNAFRTHFGFYEIGQNFCIHHLNKPL